MNDYHEGELSDVPSSNGDWYELRTPPPPPPPLPSYSISENYISSESKDGNQYITAEDYFRYDRRYTEDWQDELDKMSANNSKRRLLYMFGLKSEALPLQSYLQAYASCTASLSSYGKRNASLVKYKYDEDTKMRNNKEVKMVKVLGYVQLNFILAVNLPAAPKLGVDEPQFHILAHIAKAKDVRGDMSIKRVPYIKLGRSFALDITSIKHVVGRVDTRGEKAGGEWVIVNCSESLCPTVFRRKQEGFKDND
ncbi:hypothetical protein RhiJN_25852 [Ceratobasidium sp. AG-Ba]|nr:hypothetical protein RhiJN_25852 [Ceratobasidium sp. AG-Ba]